MSEDKIIEIIEEMICKYKEQTNEKKYNDYTVFLSQKYSNALQQILDFYQAEKEIDSKAIAHIEACKTSLGNYILSPNETEYLLKILGKGE